MGMDIGVVKIAYLERPEETAYDFARHLGLEADEADWNGSSAENTFVEFTRETMLSVLNGYAARNSLSQSDTAKIRAWLDDLPWNNDTIMLHLGW